MTQLHKIEQDIKSLSEEVEEAKTNLSENKGQLKALMDRLEKDYEFKTVEEAKAELVSMDEEIEKLKNDIETKYTALNEEITTDD